MKAKKRYLKYKYIYISLLAFWCKNENVQEVERIVQFISRAVNELKFIL